MFVCGEKRGGGKKRNTRRKKYEISILGDGTEMGIPRAVIVGNIFVRGFIYLFFFFGSVGHCCRGREKNETKTKRDARRSVFFVPISTAAAAAADVSPVRPPPNRARVGHFSGVRIVPRANAYVAQDDPLGFFPFIYYYSSSLFLRTYTCIRVYVYT